MKLYRTVDAIFKGHSTAHVPKQSACFGKKLNHSVPCVYTYDNCSGRPVIDK